jgi:hypothetical protein
VASGTGSEGARAAERAEALRPVFAALAEDFALPVVQSLAATLTGGYGINPLSRSTAVNEPAMARPTRGAVACAPGSDTPAPRNHQEENNVMEKNEPDPPSAKQLDNAAHDALVDLLNALRNTFPDQGGGDVVALNALVLCVTDHCRVVRRWSGSGAASH